MKEKYCGGEVCDKIDIDPKDLLAGNGIDVAHVLPDDVILLRPKKTLSRNAIKWVQDSINRLNRSGEFTLRFLMLPPDVDAGIIRTKDKTLYDQVKSGELK